MCIIATAFQAYPITIQVACAHQKLGRIRAHFTFQAQYIYAERNCANRATRNSRLFFLYAPVQPIEDLLTQFALAKHLFVHSEHHKITSHTRTHRIIIIVIIIRKILQYFAVEIKINTKSTDIFANRTSLLRYNGIRMQKENRMENSPK